MKLKHRIVLKSPPAPILNDGAVERGAVEPCRLSLEINGMQSTRHLPIVDALHNEKLISVICPRGAKSLSGAGKLLLPVAHPRNEAMNIEKSGLPLQALFDCPVVLCVSEIK